MIIDFLKIEKNLSIEIDKNVQFHPSFYGVIDTSAKPTKKIKITFTSLLNRFQYDLLLLMLKDEKNKFFSIKIDFISLQEFQNFYQIFQCFYTINDDVYLFFYIDNIEIVEESASTLELNFTVNGAKYMR